MTDAKQGVPTPEQQQIELIEGSRSEPDTGEEETMRLIGPTSPLALPLKGTAYPQALREDDQHAGSWRGWHIAVGACVLSLLVVLITAAVITSHPGDSQKDDYNIEFLVVGDWGRDGQHNQSRVAGLMGKVADSPQFIISVGDNFYETGLTSVEDPQFDTSFTQVYTDPSLQVPWYVVLGNHDYGELWANTSVMPPPTNCPANMSSQDCHYGPLHQLDIRLQQRDRRWHCERFWTVKLADGVIEIFFIDTSPLVHEYQKVVWAENKGGILEQSPDAQLKELEGRLARSHARWKIVVGHHPIRSDLQEYPEVGETLRPLMERYGVQAYFCGHEHNLQYVHVDGEHTHYFLSGGGSKCSAYGFVEEDSRPDLKLFHYGSGFLRAQLSPEKLEVQYYSVLHNAPFYRAEIGQEL